MVLDISWVVSGGIGWFQLVLDRFRSFQVVLRFSKDRTSQCWLRFDVLTFVQRFTSYSLLYITLIILILNLKKLLNKDSF